MCMNDKGQMPWQRMTHVSRSRWIRCRWCPGNSVRNNNCLTRCETCSPIGQTMNIYIVVSILEGLASWRNVKLSTAETNVCVCAVCVWRGSLSPYLSLTVWRRRGVDRCYDWTTWFSHVSHAFVVRTMDCVRRKTDLHFSVVGGCTKEHRMRWYFSGNPFAMLQLQRMGIFEVLNDERMFIHSNEFSRRNLRARKLLFIQSIKHMLAVCLETHWVWRRQQTDRQTKIDWRMQCVCVVVCWRSVNALTIGPFAQQPIQFNWIRLNRMQ